VCAAGVFAAAVTRLLLWCQRLVVLLLVLRRCKHQLQQPHMSKGAAHNQLALPNTQTHSSRNEQGTTAHTHVVLAMLAFYPVFQHTQTHLLPPMTHCLTIGSTRQPAQSAHANQPNSTAQSNNTPLMKPPGKGSFLYPSQALHDKPFSKPQHPNTVQWTSPSQLGQKSDPVKGQQQCMTQVVRPFEAHHRQKQNQSRS
jgi:hypothetical protein